MTEFRQFRRKQIAELRPWTPDYDMSGVSVSAEDTKAGSPKEGDMIARNPKNHEDQWLVAAAYFSDNFEPAADNEVQPLPDEVEPVCQHNIYNPPKPRTHELKTVAIYFGDMLSGRKTFEVRKNDRDFHLGDTLLLREIDDEGHATGRTLECGVGYVLSRFRVNGQNIIAPGYVVMGLGPIAALDAHRARQAPVRQPADADLREKIMRLDLYHQGSRASYWPQGFPSVRYASDLVSRDDVLGLLSAVAPAPVRQDDAERAAAAIREYAVKGTGYYTSEELAAVVIAALRFAPGESEQ